MTISNIRLRNFRGYSSVNLELKPLTVLIGPNSSGKSAFGHALAALAHAQSEYKGSVRTTLSPRDLRDAESWPIDLGQYANLVTKGSTDRIYIDLHTRDGWVELGFGALKDAEGLMLSHIDHPLAPSGSSNQPSAASTSATLQKVAESETGTIGPVKMDTSGLRLTRPLTQLWQNSAEQEMRPGLNGLLLDTVRWQTGTEIPLSNFAHIDVQQLLENTRYIRGSRKRPARDYQLGIGSPNPLGYAGEWTASLLHDPKQTHIWYSVPPKYPDTAQDAVRELDAQWETRMGSLKEAVGFWLDYMDLAHSVETVESARDKNLIELMVSLKAAWGKRDLTEVGYGISQLLPVLAAGLMQPTEGVFIVDLPEAHLHPRPQGRLADFFCSLALSGRTTIVETHSEMFFHRLRLNAAMNSTLLSDIAVYFCDPPGSDGICRQPRRVGLEFDTQCEWPENFLQEAWEVESQISAAKEARRLSKE